MSKLQAKLADLVATTVGAEGAALIDIDTGMTLAQAGTPDFDLDVAASGFATAVRYQLRTIVDLGLSGKGVGVLDAAVEVGAGDLRLAQAVPLGVGDDARLGGLGDHDDELLGVLPRRCRG